MWYDEDFYCETSEFDEQVDEFKKSLRASVKEEILAEMDRLRKENEKLACIRDHWNEKVRELENEYTAKRRELDIEIRKAKEASSNAKNLRLMELIADYPVSAYTVKIEYINQPKCSMCDSRRVIQYTTPRGRVMYEDCACKSQIKRYHLKRAPLISIGETSLGKIYPTYLVNDDAEQSYLRNTNDFADNIPFEEIKKRYSYPLFRDENRAKRFIEWMNKMENAKWSTPPISLN